MIIVVGDDHGFKIADQEGIYCTTPSINDGTRWVSIACLVVAQDKKKK